MMKLLFLIYVVIVETNGLANCPTGCQCDDNTLVVQCGEGKLDVLPIALNPSIQRLVIRQNKIKTIDSSIQFYAELNFLDLSANHLMNIPPRTFAYQKKLQELHLNDNKIGQLSNRTFVGLQTLTVLNLRNNLISELPAQAFNNLPQLQELNLAANRIGHIDLAAFDNLAELRILYLDDNALTTIPAPPILQALPRLAELMLGGNAFDTLNSSAFVNVGVGLTRLDLRGAALKHISSTAFDGLGKSLRILDLSANRLNHIPTVALSVLQRLEELTLGENDFEIIAEGAFVGMKQLKHLDISGALHLRRVMPGAFATNTNLMYLQLSSNKVLIELQEGALSGLPHLQHVILKANALSTLAEGMFPWQDLITLDISENPLSCDCRIMWLRNLLLLRNASGGADILCAYPERLRGESLRNLNPQLLGCSYGSEARRQALISALLVGSAASITALALIIYRCRRKLREYLKKGGTFGGRIKQREYQKTFCDEDYMTHHHHHNHLNHQYHHHAHQYQYNRGHMGTLSVANSNNFQAPYNMYSGMCGNQLDGQMKQSQNQSQQTQSQQLKQQQQQQQHLASCLDDSASFMMLMKRNATQLQQTRPTPLNHYTKTLLASNTSGSSVTSNESCYSYADVPLVHTLTKTSEHLNFRQHQHQQQPQQQQQHPSLQHQQQQQQYEADLLDPNYIYSNAHYSLPNELCTRAKTPTNIPPPPLPPALPLRNGTQSRRSFNVNYNNTNTTTNYQQQQQHNNNSNNDTSSICLKNHMNNLDGHNTTSSNATTTTLKSSSSTTSSSSSTTTPEPTTITPQPRNFR